MLNRIWLKLFMLSHFVKHSPGQKFCNRWRHSSTVIDKKLYVSGGHGTIATSNDSDQGLHPRSPTVDWIDLGKPWITADENIWHHISKLNSTESPGPPTLMGGAIFSNGSSLWLYGGYVLAPSSLAAIPPNDIWRYDIADGNWAKSYTTGDPVQRMCLGRSAQVGLSRTYYLGGQVDRGSIPSLYAVNNPSDYMVQGLLIFNEDLESFHNTSSVGLNEAGTTILGFLVSIGSLGGEGVLVAFGGYTAKVAQPLKIPELPDPEQYWQMQNISVYDIANQNWYQQQASGDIPPWRNSGCSLAVSAPDNSSHSIYVFGGWNMRSTQTNDGNVYVLSIPSFTWIRVTSDLDQRSEHTCHLMGNHHMLVVGGVEPVDDVQFPSGILGCDHNPKFNQGLGIFSLNAHTWVTNYDPEPGAAPYQIHTSISKVIGGNATGGATLRSPKNGFSTPGLSSLLVAKDENGNQTSAQPQPTSVQRGPKTPKTKNPRPLSNAAIAGIVVGSVGGLLLIVLTRYFILYRRQRHDGQQSLDNKAPSSASFTPIPRPPIEVGAGPIGPELRSGIAEENLARMQQSNEMPVSSEVFEIYHETETAEMLASSHKDDIYYSGSLAQSERAEVDKPLPEVPHHVSE